MASISVSHWNSQYFWPLGLWPQTVPGTEVVQYKALSGLRVSLPPLVLTELKHQEIPSGNRLLIIRHLVDYLYTLQFLLTCLLILFKWFCTFSILVKERVMQIQKTLVCLPLASHCLSWIERNAAPCSSVLGTERGTYHIKLGWTCLTPDVLNLSPENTSVRDCIHPVPIQN